MIGGGDEPDSARPPRPVTGGEQFREMVEWAPNPVLVMDRAGRIAMVNTLAERLFGYDRSEMLGQPVEMLVPKRYAGHHPSLRADFLNNPKTRPMGEGRDLFGLCKDGTEVPIEIGLNPVTTEDGLMVLSSIVDITERLQREKSIRDALKEKEILLGEIHHRVKNNLQIIYSLLDLQAARIADPKVIAMLHDSKNRVRSMALIHQTLYQVQDFSRVDFATFLESLRPNLMTSFGVNAERVSLDIEADKVYLPIDQAIPCGLIVNELVTNALKHGFPDDRSGRILITLTRAADEAMILKVSDDGVGIPDEVDIYDLETLGLQLVTLLADQLEGTLTINKSAPTAFEVRFPSAGH